MNITNTTPQPVEVNSAPQHHQVQEHHQPKAQAAPSKETKIVNQSQTQLNQQGKQTGNKDGEQTEDFIKKISHSIESADIEINSHNSQIKFSMHTETNQVLGKVIDKETQEVIREFPPEEIVEMIAAMEKRAGLFVDTKK